MSTENNPKMGSAPISNDSDDDGCEDLINALKTRREIDRKVLSSLTHEDAYDLGMRNALLALDSIDASVKFKRADGAEVTIGGCLFGLFDEIND